VRQAWKPYSPGLGATGQHAGGLGTRVWGMGALGGLAPSGLGTTISSAGTTSLSAAATADLRALAAVSGLSPTTTAAIAAAGPDAVASDGSRIQM
jgi:tetrahydromethanopterin S-methyltransferase subunit C